MKLGDLKRGLSKYPPDMDDMEVLVNVSRNNNKQFEPACFIAYYPIDDNGCVVIGGLTAVQKMVESGEIKKPDGYIEPSESNPSILGE